MERSKDSARETLKKVSQFYTKPSENPDEPPYHKYTLRGVSADPRTMYVLAEPSFSDEQIPFEARYKDETWYKISWTSNDANPMNCEVSASQLNVEYNLICACDCLIVVSCYAR